MVTAALDLGSRRIGFAVADAAGLAAHPIDVIKRHSLAHDLEALKARFVRFQVDQVIVGLPLNMDGSKGPQARAAEAFAFHLGRATGLRIHLYDERLTTFEAEERLKNLQPRKKRKGMIDAFAACVILEGWLRESRPG